MTHAIDCDLDEDCTCGANMKLVDGTYFDEDLDRYVRPEDPNWSREGWERATGEPWPFEDEDDR